jgi:para-aminobenzoate synthetase/4-amino-4-deoxychorismate lyase
MIVDLLRNDLGRVAAPAASRCRRCSRCSATARAADDLHRAGALRAAPTLAEMFAALYPCGSITGAPKRRTMEIIANSNPRRAASIPARSAGSIRRRIRHALRRLLPVGADPHAGAARPQRRAACARRNGRGRRHRVRQRSADEYAECQLKGALPDRAGRTSSRLFETMQATWQDGPRHLDLHLARMAHRRAYFGLPFDERGRRALGGRLPRLAAGAACTACACRSMRGQPRGRSRRRWRRWPNRCACCWPATPPQSTTSSCAIKPAVRSRYDAAWRAAEAQGAFDALFFNERGELTEGGRSNVFVRWWTATGDAAAVLRPAAGRDAR